MKSLIKAIGHFTNLKVSSVTDSPFKYCIITLLLAVISGFTEKDWLTIIIISIAGVFFVLGCFSYIYFMFKNPDYLRSEEYQIQQTAMKIMGDEKNINNPNIKEISNTINPNSKLVQKDKK